MLVLARRLHEEIVCTIPESFGCPERVIRIQVTRIDGFTCRLGIEADRDVVILRKELLDRNKARFNGLRLVTEEDLIDRALGEM